MVTKIQQIEGMNRRLEKAKQLVAEGKIRPVLGMESHYVVESSNGDGFYLVNEHCTCPDACHRTELHSGWCKHYLAAELLNQDRKASDETEIKEVIESLYGPQDENS